MTTHERLAEFIEDLRTAVAEQDVAHEIADRINDVCRWHLREMLHDDCAQPDYVWDIWS